MVSRKRAGIDPYILFLGAGASISSGCSSMMQIVDDVLEHYAKSEFDEFELEIKNATKKDNKFGELIKNEINKKKEALFFEVWRTLDHRTQYSILRKHLWKSKSPSEGYQSLVQLIKKDFIKTVFSTNLDYLLENTLNNAGLYQPDDFVVVVNGKDRPEEIVEQLNSSRVPLKIMKLHGSLESPKSYAFKPEEIFDFEQKIKPDLSRFINQSLIIVGYSGQDRDVDVLFENNGNEIHLVKPTVPDAESRIFQILSCGKGKLINGNDGNFDIFFKKLRMYIENEEKRDSPDFDFSISTELVSIPEDDPVIDSDFWRSHDLTAIPSILLKRVQELKNCKVVRDEYEHIYNSYKKFLDNGLISNYYMGFLSICLPSYPSMFLDMARKNIHISIIVTPNVFFKIKIEHDDEFEEFLKFENTHFYVYDNAKMTFVVTDHVLSLSLFFKNGCFDFQNDLMGFDSCAVKWGESLFEFYRDNSIEIISLHNPADKMHKKLKKDKKL